jgi:hypothetical protein
VSIALAAMLPAIALSAEGVAGESSPPKPDKPVGFGYKTNWLAVKSSNPAEVITALGLTDVKASTWQSGVRASYAFDSHYHSTAVFVTPPIKGWVLVTGKALPYPECAGASARDEIRKKFEAMFAQLAGKFDDVQFFYTYRVVGFDSWGRARHGKVDRLFSFVDGEVCFNVGAQTDKERTPGFVLLKRCITEESEQISSQIISGL